MGRPLSGRIFEPMKLRHLLYSSILLLPFASANLHAQGQPLDSLLPRIATDLHNPALAEQLHALLPAGIDFRVWGYAAGDFSNDTIPDLALSLYNHDEAGNKVRVYLFENVKGKQLVERMERTVPFIETPIEVGLSIEGSVVTIIRKTNPVHWSQEGYSIESGDVALVDRFETEQGDATGKMKSKGNLPGHDIYRNYETLRTKEAWYGGANGDPINSIAYFTIPAYQRLREIYPGYGHIATDTSKDFILSGNTFRRDSSDLSIRSIQAAYTDEYLYLAIRVRDDYVMGGVPSAVADDRVSLWFDTKYTGDRNNRDRRILSNEGGAPTFRDQLDSMVKDITFVLPTHPGRVTQIERADSRKLSSMELDGLKNIQGQMRYDTANGVVNGYALSVRIPFSFLGFETNPARFYETHSPAGRRGDEQNTEGNSEISGIGDAATLGFTAIVYDVDDPTHPNETTVEATSKYEEGNPSTLGTLVLEPSTLYYGEVHPTYLDEVRNRLGASGY